eukprot:COSAG06_NODE_6050_length_3134_cov_27.352883_4_plen_70_part_00
MRRILLVLLNRDEREGELRNASSVPRYIPSVSTAWDSSPRTLIHDRFEPIGYPWGAVRARKMKRTLFLC